MFNKVTHYMYTYTLKYVTGRESYHVRVNEGKRREIEIRYIHV